MRTSVLDMVSQVLPLAPASAEEALKLAVAEVMASPAAALQALYDHAHGSYSQVCAGSPRLKD